MIQRIGVLGLWHLGTVTAACLAKHFSVVAFDASEKTIDALRAGHAPLYEPGLNELLQEGIDRGALCFEVSQQKDLTSQKLDLLWVTIDTPVDEEDRADVEAVLGPLRNALKGIEPGILVIISSQLPIGSCALLEKEFAGAGFDFAYVPENLRLGRAISTFSEPERFVAGIRSPQVKDKLAEVLGKFTRTIEWMSPESAEMTKHALNSFLALSVTFANEVARLCEATGADMMSVTAGLKSDRRIGPLAYLSAGEAFAGGTLARDVIMLSQLAERVHERTHVLEAIRPSNEAHKGWAWNKLKSRFNDFHGRKIVLLGLSYKPGTDTLRRSSGVELADMLAHAGATVWVWDPVIKTLSPELETKIHLAPSLAEAISGADALVVATNWPEFLKAPWKEMLPTMKEPLILDAGRFLQTQIPSGTTYLAVGTV